MRRDDLLPADRGHIDSLDGLRAIAAFVVLIFHVAYSTADILTGSGAWRIVAHGDVGVPIFFALSGLLLYRPWARRTLEGGAAPKVRTYLWRRALRILPAYWAVVVVALFAFNAAHATTPTVWLEWLTLTQIYDLHPWWQGTGPHGLGQMWSLSTELAFYALLPIIAAALASYAGYDNADVDTRARRLLVSLGVLALGSLVWIAVVHQTAYGYYYELWLPRSICWFAAGMALTVFAEWARAESGSPYGPISRLCRTIASMPGVCWLVAAAAWGLVSTPLAGPAFLQGTPSVFQSEAKTVLYLIIALGLVAPAAFQPGGKTVTTTLLGNKTMRFLGKISYGVFLWQFVIIYAWYELTDRPFWNHDFWIVLPIVLVGSVVAATISFYAIEQPAQRLKTVSSRWAVTLPETPRPEPAPSPPAPAVDARTGRWHRTP
ncbi:MAG TPA: acyltransferase [Streptosporangiaceae bacterium]|nr:acyltransferase [Streptosporangiaceae bacterium]